MLAQKIYKISYLKSITSFPVPKTYDHIADGKDTWKIRKRIALAKAAYRNKAQLFTRMKLSLKIEKCLYEYVCYGVKYVWNMSHKWSWKKNVWSTGSACRELAG